jgi:hypothetical protein
VLHPANGGLEVKEVKKGQVSTSCIAIDKGGKEQIERKEK